MRLFTSTPSPRPANAPDAGGRRPDTAPKGSTAPKPAPKRCLNEAAHKLYR